MTYSPYIERALLAALGGAIDYAVDAIVENIDDGESDRDELADRIRPYVVEAVRLAVLAGRDWEAVRAASFELAALVSREFGLPIDEEGEDEEADD